MTEPDFTASLKTERLTDIALAYKQTCAMLTGLELGIFNAISDGATSLRDIAHRVGLEAEKVDRLLTVCKAIKLLREVDGRYENYSDVERYLVSSKRGFVGDYLTYIARRDYDAWPELTENLRAEAPPANRVEGDERTYLSVMDDPEYARKFTMAGYEGSIALGGIGCHGMAVWMPERRTLAVNQMGAEGANWIGQAPFAGVDHIFQNMGDGTYFHSGLLAIRAAIAANVNILVRDHPQQLAMRFPSIGDRECRVSRFIHDLDDVADRVLRRQRRQ